MDLTEKEYKQIIKVTGTCYDMQIEANKIYKYMNIGILGLALLGYNISTKGGNSRSGRVRITGFLLYMVPFCAQMAGNQLITMNLGQL